MTARDTSHLDALITGRRHEQARLDAATRAREIGWRKIQVRRYDREIVAEMDFLDQLPLTACDAMMTADEIADALA